MNSPILGLAAVVLIVAVLAYVLWSSHKTETRRQAEYHAFAASRGYEFSFLRSRGRQPAEVRFADPASGMNLTVTRSHSRKSGNSTRSVAGHSTLRLPEPRFPGGMAVYSAQLADGMAAAATKLMGVFDNSLARMLMGKLLGDDIGAHLGELRDFAAPAGVPLTIMATVDPNAMFDAATIARAIGDAPNGPNAESKTMILLTETGLQMRIGRPLNEVADIAQFIDAATILTAGLRG